MREVLGRESAGAAARLCRIAPAGTNPFVLVLSRSDVDGNDGLSVSRWVDAVLATRPGQIDRSWSIAPASWWTGTKPGRHSSVGSAFERPPRNQPARFPYRLFQQAVAFRGGADDRDRGMALNRHRRAGRASSCLPISASIAPATPRAKFRDSRRSPSAISGTENRDWVSVLVLEAGAIRLAPAS